MKDTKKQPVKKKPRCSGCGYVLDSKRCLLAHRNVMNQSAHINPFNY